MGDPVKLTAIQLGVLRDIADGRIVFSRHALRFWNARTKHFMRRTTMQALSDKAVCHVVGIECQPTDAGRRVLEEQ